MVNSADILPPTHIWNPRTCTFNPTQLGFRPGDHEHPGQELGAPVTLSRSDVGRGVAALTAAMTSPSPQLMDAVMLQLTRARNRLTTPATLTLPEIAASGLTVSALVPPLPQERESPLGGTRM